MKTLNRIGLIILSCLLLTIAAFNNGAFVNAHSADVNKIEATNLVETRCGWFENPTPANADLIDKDGEWTIGVQGGDQAEGDWPAFTDKQWVKTNGNYGYGCACMQVTVNRKTFDIVKIISAKARPLSACRKDPALKSKEPKD